MLKVFWIRHSYGVIQAVQTVPPDRNVARWYVKVVAENEEEARATFGSRAKTVLQRDVIVPPNVVIVGPGYCGPLSKVSEGDPRPEQVEVNS